MEPKTIYDRHGQKYTLSVEAGDECRGSVRGQAEWTLQFSLKSRLGEPIGHGDLRLVCATEHRHLDDDQIFSTLVAIGTDRIREDFDRGNSVESKSYTFKVDSCLFLTRWLKEV